MTDIYIPVGPAELVDQIVLAHRLPPETMPKQRLSKMELIADNALPTTAHLSAATVIAARQDVIQLEADMRGCEERSDFGTGFVALARAYLDALDTLARVKDSYDAAAIAALQTSTLGTVARDA